MWRIVQDLFIVCLTEMHLCAVAADGFCCCCGKTGQNQAWRWSAYFGAGDGFCLRKLILLQ